ncbi:MAG: arylsulfatase [Pseudomonadales bacterium]|jgi:arylsulfatase A-like enzyme|nr:arylsulfatase [Pseudomonadales bacterium]MCP5336712.1 arylsulfatase [Pseudomonadales bacterium]
MDSIRAGSLCGVRRLFAAALAIAASLAIVVASEAAGAADATTAAQVPPLQSRPPAGAPNVVLVLLDDVGFGASSTFGGPADTPTLDALARDGLRYNRFHTTAICSPTRAALLSGRNAHAVGIGAVMNTADSRPGYRGVHIREATPVAELLRRAGYSTAAFGKWHQTPDWEISQSGPFDRWPTGQGFEKFYGFIGGETDEFAPALIEGTTPVLRPANPDYHLTQDLVDHAIRWMHAQRVLTPDKPFFVYLAPGATHAPLQAPREWIERYRGRFDAGWDAMRGQILARQKELGVVPADTVLTPRPEGMPAWDSLDDRQKKLAARLMEVYAGYLAHTDHEVGRLLQALKDSGEYDNTLFIYIVGDNGASPEGGLYGSINYMGVLQGLPEPPPPSAEQLDRIGSADSYAHYPVGWAWAMDSPFQWTKTVASHLGGTRNPMVVSWPRQIRDKGGVRSQFGHVNDIAPTILEVAGVAAPAVVDGIRQKPMDGTSLVYSFTDVNAPERHRTQYFEVFGNRAIYHDGWMASAFHNRLPWTRGVVTAEKPFEDDRWELYDLQHDYSQSRDLAAQEPQRLEKLKKLFMQEAAANQVLPLQGPSMGDPAQPSLSRGRSEFSYYPGAVGVPEVGAPQMLNRSWTVKATLDVPARGAHGVVATIGGRAAGWSLYLDGQGRPVFRYRLFDLKTVELAGAQALAPGQHELQVDFDYDGGGYAKGGRLQLQVDGAVAAEDRLPATPPAFFSIHETFDVGVDTGSYAGEYPQDAAIGYPAPDGLIERVDMRLR